ncbi:mechanosensitive ion channel family protein [Candidatus Woesearchaeota archaeon]|nr:mechanosensitive ion channel family protein [Candidatus Woesearchaeota archaeon]
MVFSLDSLAASPYASFLLALIIIVLSLALAVLVHTLMNIYLATIAKKTGTTLDDTLVSALKKPMYALVLFTGGFLAILQLGILSGFIDVLTRVYKAGLIVLVAYASSKIFTAFVAWHMGKRRGAETQVARHFLPLANRAATVFIYIVAVIGLLDQFNVKVTALVASVGVLSLAVALSLQDTLANFFAGIYVMADRPVRVGDFIRLENGEEGLVADIGWRSTKIRTLNDNFIIMPNSKLAQSIVVNYYLPNQGTNVFVRLGVAYDSDLDKVERLALKAAKLVQQKMQGQVDYEPFVRFVEFGSVNIVFTVSIKVDDALNKQLVAHELIKNLTREFADARIRIR